MNKNEELNIMDLLPLLCSSDEKDVNLGIGIFNSTFAEKKLKFPKEFKDGLRAAGWSNLFSVEWVKPKTRKFIRTIKRTEYVSTNYYLYLI